MAIIVTFMKGLPGSGKSTWARQQKDARIVCRDDIRHMLGEYSDFSDEREAIVTEITNAAIVALVRRGCNVIIDETHTRPEGPRNIMRLLAGYEVDYRVQDFSHIPRGVCRARVRTRHERGGIYIPPEVMASMHRNLVENPWDLDDLFDAERVDVS